MEEKQEEIIKKINNLEDVKRIKELKEKLKHNKKYNSLIETKITSNEELIKVRKELFEIDDFKEYQSLYSKLKLELLKINKIITSLVDDRVCKKYE